MVNETIKSLREALVISPENVPLRLYLAQSMLNENLHNEAAVEFTEVLKRSYGNTDARLGLAEVYYHLKKYSVAIIIYEELHPKLFFKKHGKYALTQNERLNALLFMLCLFAGLCVVLIGMTVTAPDYSTPLKIAGCILMSLCLPAGHIELPWRFKNNSEKQWFAIGFTTYGMLSVILCLLNVPFLYTIAVFYISGLVVFMWINAFCAYIII